MCISEHEKWGHPTTSTTIGFHLLSDTIIVWFWASIFFQNPNIMDTSHPILFIHFYPMGYPTLAMGPMIADASPTENLTILIPNCLIDGNSNWWCLDVSKTSPNSGYGGFLRHRSTPSYHPFQDGIFPFTKTIQLLGFPHGKFPFPDDAHGVTCHGHCAATRCHSVAPCRATPWCHARHCASRGGGRGTWPASEEPGGAGCNVCRPGKWAGVFGLVIGKIYRKHQETIVFTMNEP